MGTTDDIEDSIPPVHEMVIRAQYDAWRQYMCDA